MQTRWQLRPNIKWHDGPPFTADDIVFSWQVNTDPAIPLPGTASAPAMERLEAIDPHAVRITWKTTFYKAIYLAFTELWPYPKHLLHDAFQGDKEAFLNLPFWTTQLVHVGPFRMADFGLGENLVLERFDDYYLGRPKVDTILIRIIGDPNTIYANVRAETVDIVSESAIPVELFVRLRDEWKERDGGKVLQGAGTWTFLNVQYHPEWSKVPELRQDARVRSALLTAIDGDALRAVILPGFPDTEPDSFMPKSDPRAPAVGKPFARFRYDHGQALRDLADAGWRKGPDGQIVNATGEPVEIPFRATPSGATAMAIVSQAWRDQGLRVAQEVVPGSLVSDRGYRASFPGMEITAQSSGDAMLRRFDGRQCPQPPRFSGSQGGCYMNSDLDRLIDKLYGTVDIQQQGLVLRDIGEVMAANVVTLPVYFSVRLAAVRQGVQTPSGAPGRGLQPALPTRNAHLWDRTPAKVG